MSCMQVAEVLRSSDSLTVSEDGKRVRRSQPITSLEDAAKVRLPPALLFTGLSMACSSKLGQHPLDWLA